MLSLHDYWFYAVTSAAIIIVPGPTMMTVISFALHFGRAVALRAALAVMAASVTTIILAGAGLSILLTYTPWLVSVLTIFSGLFCLYTASKIARQNPTQLQLNHNVMTEKKHINAMVFKNCYVITVLNPKGHIFFIAFLPQFLDKSPNLWVDIPILALVFAGIDCITALSYGFLAGTLRQRINNPNFKYISLVVFVIVGFMAIYYGINNLI